MSKSQLFGVGLKTLLKGTRVHVTSAGVKPMVLATAAATAPSKPLPFSGLSSTNHGSKTGWSVAIVSLPGAKVFSDAFAHGSALAGPVPDARAEVWLPAVWPPPGGAQAAIRAAPRASRALAGRAARAFTAGLH